MTMTAVRSAADAAGLAGPVDASVGLADPVDGLVDRGSVDRAGARL